MAAATAACVVFVYDRPLRVVFGLLAVAAYAGQDRLGGGNDRYRFAVEIIGALAMSSTAAAVAFLPFTLCVLGWLVAPPEGFKNSAGRFCFFGPRSCGT